MEGRLSRHHRAPRPPRRWPCGGTRSTLSMRWPLVLHQAQIHQPVPLSGGSHSDEEQASSASALPQNRPLDGRFPRPPPPVLRFLDIKCRPGWSRLSRRWRPSITSAR